ncbi:MAG: hypothetical protein AAF495_17265 [Pseudomonadota bacterium]
MSKAAVITGLASELDCLAAALPPDEPALRAFLACAAAEPARAAIHADSYLALGVKHLVSFGVCGALDPDLKPGQILLPERVITKVGWAFEADRAWRDRLAALAEQAGLEVSGGDLMGSDHLVAEPTEKARLFADKGARAVDMESHMVARSADKAEAAFVALRVVADPTERAIPEIAQGLIAPNGRPRNGLAAARLLAQPWRLPAMLELRRDFRTAMASLDQASRALADGLLIVED